MPRESVDQVEVLRGGASHLYGGTALSGVVNVLSRAPETSSLSAELSYGNQQSPGGSLFGSVRRGKWTMSLGAEISKTDGYIIVDEDERGPIDTPAGSRYSVANLNSNGKSARTATFSFAARPSASHARTARRCRPTHLRNPLARREFRNHGFWISICVCTVGLKSSIRIFRRGG